MMTTSPVFILTLQNANHYDSQAGDELKVLGQDISFLLTSKILKIISHDSKIAIFAPKSIYQSILCNPLPSNILLVERNELSFDECIGKLASHKFSQNSDHFIWLNSRILNFDFQEVFEALNHKLEYDLDLVFSSNAQPSLIADEKSKILNLISSNVEFNSAFFDRSNLVHYYTFNRKFFIISKKFSSSLNDANLKYGFYPTSTGISIDQLIGTFPEHTIATLFLG